MGVKVELNSTARTNAMLADLQKHLQGIQYRVVACSGGIDSLTLSHIAHNLDPCNTVIAHAVTAAVPAECTERVKRYAKQHGWQLHLVETAEFQDERYLSNPANRCFYCKANLYETLELLGTKVFTNRPESSQKPILLSGANTDDLGDYRPGLQAAKQFCVRHPFVEVGLSKSAIRAVARAVDIKDFELASSPCLASRIYTGTRVSDDRLAAIEAGEVLLRSKYGFEIVRCRIRENTVLVEVEVDEIERVDRSVLAAVFELMKSKCETLTEIAVEEDGYSMGAAFLHDE